MRDSLKIGDKIITIGGIRGEIVKTREDVLTIQVGSDKVKFEVMRWAISKVEESGAEAKGGKPAAKEKEEELEKQTKKPKRLTPKSDGEDAKASEDGEAAADADSDEAGDTEAKKE